MDKNTQYGSDQIEILEGLEGVRRRPAMYIGSTNATGLHHLVWEIIDNSLDEALNGYGDKITVTIHKDGSISVLDEGRGIPCGIHPKAKIPAVQLIFSTLHSGGKFNDEAYKSSAGLHGVGSSVTNALSEFCDITVYRDGKIYHLRFEDGGRKLAQPMEILGETKKHGTLITFKPDKKIFSTVEFSYEKITSHLQQDAYLLKKVRFILIDERNNIKDEYYYENGLKEFIEKINAEKTPIGPVITFSGTQDKIETEIAMQYCYNDYNETIRSYVNNVHTADGGTHESGFKAGITKAVNDYAEDNNLLRNKVKLEGSDIREGLTAIISLRMPESVAELEGQTKGKLNTQIAQNIVSDLVYTNFTYYLNENKEFAIRLIKKCQESQNARLAARKAKEEARKVRKTKESIILSDKLTPAQSKDYKNNELFIVEGDSAGGNAKKARNAANQAILPLRGKPLNTDGLTIDKIKSNLEFATIINVIGAGVGQNFDVEDIHYNKVIIMADADADGAHIQTLLLSFFYNYMRDLITQGHVYLSVPPLYRVYKKDAKNNIVDSVYVWRDEQLEEAKNKIGPGYEISRYKGLGEMDAIELKTTTMDQKTRLLVKVTIDDPLAVESEVSTLMGRDSDRRKKWLESNVDFSTNDSFINEVKRNG